MWVLILQFIVLAGYIDKNGGMEGEGAWAQWYKREKWCRDRRWYSWVWLTKIIQCAKYEITVEGSGLYHQDVESENQYLKLGAHILTVEVEYIYFMTCLSRRGAPIYLTGPWGGEITTQGLIYQYYFPGMQMCGKKIPIKDVMDLSLWVVLFTMQRISGSEGSH